MKINSASDIEINYSNSDENTDDGEVEVINDGVSQEKEIIINDEELNVKDGDDDHDDELMRTKKRTRMMKKRVETTTTTGMR